MANTENLKIKFYKLFEIERIAQKELSDAGEFYNEYRLDIESFIIKKYNLIPDTFHGLKSNYDTWAFIIKDSNRIFIDNILLDDDRKEKKYRFTLGEELAHYLIHHDIFGNCKSIEERNKIYFSLPEKDRNYIENDARSLSSAILMKKNMVEEIVDQLTLTIDIDIDSMSNEHIVGKLATKMTHYFDINFSAARSRLKMLGYHRRF